jgi:hypothetical protein
LLPSGSVMLIMVEIQTIKKGAKRLLYGATWRLQNQLWKVRVDMSHTDQRIAAASVVFAGPDFAT